MLRVKFFMAVCFYIDVAIRTLTEQKIAEAVLLNYVFEFWHEFEGFACLL